jgi:hypothetical protein
MIQAFLFAQSLLLEVKSSVKSGVSWLAFLLAPSPPAGEGWGEGGWVIGL